MRDVSEAPVFGSPTGSVYAAACNDSRVAWIFDRIVRPAYHALQGCSSCDNGICKGVCVIVAQVADDIRALHAVAQKRRAARQAAGALRLDNTKLAFQLDASGQPISCSAHEQR